MTVITSNGQLLIDNQIISYVPGSLKIKYGDGETKVFSQTLGDGQVETLFAEDDESRIGMISFSKRPAASGGVSLQDLTAAWKTGPGTHAVRVIEKDGVTSVMAKCAMTNDPDFEKSPDGQIEVIFQGTPVAR